MPCKTCEDIQERLNRKESTPRIVKPQVDHRVILECFCGHSFVTDDRRTLPITCTRCGREHDPKELA